MAVVVSLGFEVYAVVMSCEAVREHLRGGEPQPTEAQRTIAQHLDACAGCREEHETIVKLLDEYPDALLAPALPDAALRARLLESTRHGRTLRSFAGAVARLFALPERQARDLLVQLEGPEGWRPGVLIGHWVRKVKPGRSLGEHALGMIVRTSPGVVVPRHGHIGEERTFVLQGGYADSLGGEVWAGEHVELPAGSQHELHVLPPVECIAAVLVRGGLQLAR